VARVDIISSFREKARGKNLSVVIPVGRDERIIRAARRLKDEDIARPIMLGKPSQIEAAIEKAGVNLDDIKTINPRQSNKLDFYAKKYSRQRKGLSPAVAKRIVIKPLFYAGMMVACGDADIAVGGVAGATATLIQTGVLTVGLIPGIKTPSSYFLMVIQTGVQLDNAANQTAIAKEAEINTKDSKVKVFVIPTNEQAAIANDTYELTYDKQQIVSKQNPSGNNAQEQMETMHGCKR
jgi:phosphotransacetylase